MFSQEFECPEGKSKEEIKQLEKKGTSCEGCRIEGTLVNCCAARCPVYVGRKRPKVD